MSIEMNANEWDNEDGEKPPEMTASHADLVQRICDYENGDQGEEETIAFFQDLVDSGLAWQLQGSYGRTAAAMIANGLIHPPKARSKD